MFQPRFQPLAELQLNERLQVGNQEHQLHPPAPKIIAHAHIIHFNKIVPELKKETNVIQYYATVVLEFVCCLIPWPLLWYEMINGFSFLQWFFHLYDQVNTIHHCLYQLNLIQIMALSMQLITRG